MAIVLEGVDAVKAARQVIGATNPLEATTGSIRGDFAIEMGQNMVHGSGLAGVCRARVLSVLSGPLAAVAAPLALVLASRSPQRRVLLERLNVPVHGQGLRRERARAG